MALRIPSIRRRAVLGGVLADLALIAVATSPPTMEPPSVSVLVVYFGGILVYTFLANETRGVFWAINAWVLEAIRVPPRLVANYGTLVVVCIGVASALVLMAGSTVAGGLAANRGGVVRTLD